MYIYVCKVDKMNRTRNKREQIQCTNDEQRFKLISPMTVQIDRVAFSIHLSWGF